MPDRRDATLPSPTATDGHLTTAALLGEPDISPVRVAGDPSLPRPCITDRAPRRPEDAPPVAETPDADRAQMLDRIAQLTAENIALARRLEYDRAAIASAHALLARAVAADR